jgi:hypothetical protein
VVSKAWSNSNSIGDTLLSTMESQLTEPYNTYGAF